MEYQIETTVQFETWLNSLSITNSARIQARIDRVQQGNFGDYKSLGDDLYELRFFFGSGYRVYYTVRDGKIVLLIAGGDKSRQRKDIKHAKHILSELE